MPELDWDRFPLGIFDSLCIPCCNNPQAVACCSPCTHMLRVDDGTDDLHQKVVKDHCHHCLSTQSTFQRCNVGSRQTADVHWLQDVGYLYLFALALQCLIMLPYMIKAREHKQTVQEVIWRLLDLVTFFAPAGLPTVLFVVGAVARTRLNRVGLLLMFPAILKRGATLDVVCFDKTGTLTHSAVSLLCCCLLVSALHVLLTVRTRLHSHNATVCFLPFGAIQAAPSA